MHYDHWKALKVSLITLSGFLLLAAIFNIRLMIEVQTEGCLPFSFAVLRYHQVTEFNRGDIIAFTPNRRMGDAFYDKVVVKMIGAVPGDSVEIKSDSFLINGKEFGKLTIAAKAAKYMGRDIKSFERSEIVPPGNLLAVGTLPRTFDGRYWGFLPQSAVLGTVYPIF